MEKGTASMTTFGWGNPRRPRGSEGTTCPAEDESEQVTILDERCILGAEPTLGVVLRDTSPHRKGKGGIPRRHTRGLSRSHWIGAVQTKDPALYAPLLSWISWIDGPRCTTPRHRTVPILLPPASTHPRPSRSILAHQHTCKATRLVPRRGPASPGLSDHDRMETRRRNTSGNSDLV